MFCKKCGYSLPEESSFCPGCGAPVAASTPDEGETSAAPASAPETGEAPAAASVAADSGFDPADVAANKGVCAVAYLWILFFLPMVLHPESKYCRFHSNQGLLFLIFSAAVSIARELLLFLLRLIFRSAFGLGWLCSLLTGLVSFAAGVLIFGMMIIGIYNALNGKAEGLPVIGKFKLL